MIYSLIADEITCEDTSNPNDWNANGVINLEEFYYFSAAWLSHDPNEFTDPNFIDPDEIANWNPVCNLDASEDSEYEIDLADLLVFLDIDNWLWEACWREGYISAMSAMAGGGESMMIPMSIPMEYSAPATAPVEEEVAISEESVEDILGYLDVFIEENSTNVENLYDMKDYLEELLIEIQE